MSRRDDGTETYDINPLVQAVFKASIYGHAAKLEADIALAMESYGIPLDLRRIANHTWKPGRGP